MLPYNLLTFCRAVQHLHDKGVVHGDLKPPNILWDADSATFKLIDFGVSFTSIEELTHAVQSKGEALSHKMSNVWVGLNVGLMCYA